jgi:hypothetical protein
VNHTQEGDTWSDLARSKYGLSTVSIIFMLSNQCLRDPRISADFNTLAVAPTQSLHDLAQ